ncbi:MAG: hypothetical protein ACJ77S_04790 [Gemmatimonadaceae bacterium]
MTGKHPTLSAVALTLLFSASASAQGSSGFSLGVGGGFARSNNLGLGYEVTSTLEVPSLFGAVRPRFDLLLADYSDGPNLVALSANALVTPFASPRVAPYLLLGMGAYIEETSRPPKFGGSLGAGLRLPGQFRSVVIESQLHLYLLADRWAAYQGPNSQQVVDPSLSRNRMFWKPIGITIQF